ncbi:hypothetical protein [Terricaulis sp.]|jgi:hypothetical protein|uniref:hypothetical protein n=1 Tax=Terricaulis sp. TaxID=2768686 RepID=UPI002AC46534|nr:hypothetical protein [Terricaulis sp.]MDZ4690872.1 hypothetical protein [Terricaulis sp.]
MKVLIGAAAAAFMLMASPALAQATMTANCSGFDAAPTLPDGATASRAEIEAANTRVQAWNEARRAKLVTCQADINAMSQAFNAAEQERRTLATTWDAEVTEFNARESSGSGRRERGGVVTRPDR